MYKSLLILTLSSVTCSLLCQKLISPLQFEYTRSSFKQIEGVIIRDVNKSVEIFDRNDSLTIETLRKYAWEGFYNLLVARDTSLIKQVAQQNANILKYQSMWSSYYHIKSKGSTYTYGNMKGVNYKYLVEALIDDEDFFSQ